MAYFQILVGLRGCYMPDSAYVIRCNTRRELKAALESESSYFCDDVFGLNKRVIAWAAAKAWRERRQIGRQSAILPYGFHSKRELGKFCSIEVHPASRAEFLESETF